MDNPSSCSPPPPLPSPNPPQPQASPTASGHPSPEAKPNLELVPFSATANPKPDSNSSPQSPPAAAAKKSPPFPWTHQETVSLIQIYQEKWYTLKKGQLKANQWEDVAADVAARCGYDAPSKTATQCRHKIEKLRKRYRAERLKPYPNSWQYFDLMDRIERGPTAITVAAAVKYQNQKNKEAESDDGEANYAGLELKKNKLKSINNIVRVREVGVSGNGSRYNVSRIGMRSRNLGGAGENVRALKGLRTSLIQKRKGYFQGDPESVGADDDDDDYDDEAEELEEEEEEEEEQEQGVKGKGGGRAVVGKELAAEIMGFADRFMRMEKKKVEMMRETERFRMEMEKKRMDMIVEAQRKVVDTIGKAFGAHKKVKVGQEI